MSKSESKYLNCEKLMNEALAILINKTPYEYIKVKDVCSKAGVSRSTFYLHYDSLDDLLNETIDNLNKNFFKAFKENDEHMYNLINNGTLEDLNLITPHYLIPYLQFVLENKNIYYAHCTKPNLMRTNEQFNKITTKIMNPILERFNVEESEKKYIISFFITGFNAIIKTWIKNKCVEPIEKISSLIIKCVRAEYHGNHV